MLPDSLQKWDAVFAAKAEELYPSSDPSHDFLHIRRVVAAATRLAAKEGADLNVVLPAAYFHDFVNVPKSDPRRAQASTLSADAAVEYLQGIGYPAAFLGAIAHAIKTHSFSANIPCETIEAKVVQDADRLDGLGAIGIARCFSTSAILGRPYYSEEDMLARARMPDDRAFAIDHFFVKLFKTAETLQTAAARAEGARRVAFMKDYLQQLEREVAG
ncbi:MAG TPA: HD domain-containing protein [Patescibacteria group bacterium]|nr:HD domain-containing protein [Patescibacteria group bacterium]